MSAEVQVSGVADLQTANPRYQFKDGIWDVICDVMNWPNTLAAARALRISDTTISRAVRGETAPGEVLMARLKHALPGTWKHEHIFELVLEDQP
jgi:hypothetical protein